MQTSPHIAVADQPVARSRAWAMPRVSATALALLGLLALGLALRLWFLSLNVIDPRFSASDDGDYYQRALRLAVTGVYSDDSWLIRPPGHIFFFAAMLRLGLALGDPGLGLTLIRAAQVALSLLGILAGYDIARRLFSPAAGIIFAFILAVWLPFVELPSLLLSEPLFLYCLIFQLWALLRWRDSRHPRDLALAGALLGLAALARSPALYSAGLVLIFLLLECRTALNSPTAEREIAPVPKLAGWPGRFARAALIFLIPLALVVGPWTLRNYLVYGQLVLVDTLGPTNLLLSLADDGVAAKQAIGALPQEQRQSYISSEISRLLAEQPGRLTRNFVPHFLHIWKAQFVEDFFVKVSFYTRPVRELWPLGLTSDLIWLGFTLAACFGLTARPREGAFRLLAIGWVGYAALTVMLFHVEPRYLLPLYFFCGLYGAGAVGPLFIGGGLRNRGIVMGLALAIGFLMIFFTYRDYPAIIGQGLARERHHMAGTEALARGDLVGAATAFQAMVDIQPEFIDGRSELARALLAAGRPDEAWAAIGDRRTHRSDVLRGAIARAQGDDAVAAMFFSAAEVNAGEDIQRLTMNWLAPPPLRELRLGDGLDFGYVQGFSQGERAALPDGGVISYRWLEGAGQIRLPLGEPLAPGGLISLHMISGRSTPVLLNLRVGGEQFELLVAPGVWRRYSLPLPASLSGQRELMIELRAATFIPMQAEPTSSDARPLSIMIADCRLQIAD